MAVVVFIYSIHRGNGEKRGTRERVKGPICNRSGLDPGRGFVSVHMEPVQPSKLLNAPLSTKELKDFNNQSTSNMELV